MTHKLHTKAIQSEKQKKKRGAVFRSVMPYLLLSFTIPIRGSYSFVGVMNRCALNVVNLFFFLKKRKERMYSKKVTPQMKLLFYTLSVPQLIHQHSSQK